MGAVSAVFQAARDPGIAGVVLDSPFASLAMTSNGIVETKSIRNQRLR